MDEVYVVFQRPHYDTRGDAEVLGVFSTETAAQAYVGRKWLADPHGLQPLEIVKMVVNESREEDEL